MLDFMQVSDLGNNRDKFLAKVTRVAGKGNWFWAFVVKKKLYSWEWGLQLYEDAFWEFFRHNAPILKDLVDNHSNVFVINRFDIEANLDYKKQTQNSDHYSDIAIRRCFVRFGLSFKGKDILDLNKSQFSQSIVPFHLPHLINKPDANNSVKSWLDTNRIIVIAPEVEDKAKLADMLIR
jgi:hypothetical protein